MVDNPNFTPTTDVGEVGPHNNGRIPPTKYTRSLFIVSVSDPSSRIEIQNVPEKFDVNPKSNLVAISTPGRNNPFYNYTGSEDELNFELSYYANEESRGDVIEKCKWLEAMSKNDGFKARLKRVMIIWKGHKDSPDNGGDLFQFSEWLVKSAPYNLSSFHPQYGMLPTLAKQTVTLVKVTDYNLTTEKISDRRY